MNESKKTSLLSPHFPKIIQIGFILFFWCTLFFFLIITGLYFWKFSSSLSDDLTAWGQTGDFFGGLLNPLIGILNLYITIIIALRLNKLTEDQGTKQIEIQKSIMRRQLQFEVVKVYSFEFKTQIETMQRELTLFKTGSNEDPNEIKKLKITMSQFELGGGVLFKVFKENPTFYKLWNHQLNSLDKWDTIVVNNSIGHFYDKISDVNAEILGIFYAEILETT